MKHSADLLGMRLLINSKRLSKTSSSSCPPTDTIETVYKDAFQILEKYISCHHDEIVQNKEGFIAILDTHISNAINEYLKFTIGKLD